MAPESPQQAAAASETSGQPRRRDPAQFVARYLSGKKVPNQELQFLGAVCRVCKASKAKGLTTLPFNKEAAGEEIKEIMEDSFFQISDSFLQTMETIRHLSQFQPPLGVELKGSIVAWALRLVLSGPKDPQHQALQAKAEHGLRMMLRGMLTEDPSAAHLVALLEHLAYWVHCSSAAVRSRALSQGTSLLQFAGHLPSFKMQDEAALGHLVVQLAVSLVDPEAGIRAQARETLGQLHRMLLFQRGLTRKSENPLWKADPGQPWKEGFRHLLHVREVFWSHLSVRQRWMFASAAWDNVLHLAQEWVREGSLVLLYSLLGRAQELLEEEEEDDMKLNLSALLYGLWKGREVPSEIGALLPQTGDTGTHQRLL